MIRKFLLFTLILLLSVVIYLYFFLGFRKSVEIKISQKQSQLVLYKSHLGPYHEILPTLEDVERHLQHNNQICEPSFGHYLDNPDLVDPERLRSEGGCFVKESRFENEEFKIGHIPFGNYVVAFFEGSPSIGPWTVYPSVKKFARDQKLILKEDVYEIYHIEGNRVRTEYLFPIAQGDTQ